MCDCYTAICEFCDSKIETHIADYCVPRDSIAAVCHECVDSGRKFDRKGWYLVDESTIERLDQVWISRHGDIIDIGNLGRVVRFYSNDPAAYGVHLN